jgi:hypothetical protein
MILCFVNKRHFPVPSISKMTTTTTFKAISKIIERRQFGTDIPDASMIMPGLYLGNAAAAIDAPSNGFTAIVNCAVSDCLTNYDDSVHYIENDISFDGVLPGRVETFITRHRSLGRKVLIHCTSGMNLSAVVAVAYYMVEANVDLVTAVQHCFSCRPILLTADCFVRMLIEFAQQQRVYELQQKAAELEEELIAAKREIAVLTLDCDSQHLTLDDYNAMMDKMSSDMLATGITSDEKSKKYLKICALYDEKRKENNL